MLVSLSSVTTVPFAKATPSAAPAAIVEVPVGRGLLGRVVDGLGNPIDGKGPLTDVKQQPR